MQEPFVQQMFHFPLKTFNSFQLKFYMIIIDLINSFILCLINLIRYVEI